MNTFKQDMDKLTQDHIKLQARMTLLECRVRSLESSSCSLDTFKGGQVRKRDAQSCRQRQQQEEDEEEGDTLPRKCRRCRKVNNFD